jgi:hypothetical protein
MSTSYGLCVLLLAAVLTSQSLRLVPSTINASEETYKVSTQVCTSVIV